MGIHFSHGDHSMSCTGFNAFRIALAASVGIPLELMEDWYHPGRYWPIDGAIAMVREPEHRIEAWGRVLDLCHGLRKPEFGWTHEPPIAWSDLKNHDDPLYPLLTASDAEGRIPSGQTGALADRMAGLREAFLSGAGSGMARTFDAFLDGLRAAHAKGKAFAW